MARFGRIKNKKARKHKINILAYKLMPEGMVRQAFEKKFPDLAKDLKVRAIFFYTLQDLIDYCKIVHGTPEVKKYSEDELKILDNANRIVNSHSKRLKKK